jgi:hypothetical protein
MRELTARLPLDLRATLLALLVLGVAIRPMLVVLCDIHQAAHPAATAAAAALDGDDHEHQLAHAPDGRHTHGTHGQLFDGQFGACADIAPRLDVALVHAPDERRHELASPPPRSARVAGPFRPPILG